MKTEKKSITAIIFYVFAVLYLAYTAFCIFTAYEYVATYVAQGSISYATDFKDIFSLYMQQAGPSLVYSLILYGIGYIIDVATKIKSAMDVNSVKVEETSNVTFAANKPIMKAEKETKKEIVKETPEKEEVKVEEVKKEVAKETKAKEKKATNSKAKKEVKPATDTKEES